MADVRSALITGITGQDGSFLAELLLEKGYAVTGISRRDAHAPLGSSEHLREEIAVVTADIADRDALSSVISSVRPSELYHLAAPSFVPRSWEEPAETVGAIAATGSEVMSAVRRTDPSIRVFMASSGAIFGDALESPQNEQTTCRPTNPYAIAKLALHQLVGVIREHDGLHVSSGICFNHESERRPEAFVTRRISRAVASIALGLQSELTLGSLDAVRDWSFAGDIVHGAWMMLQQEEPGDYVLASGIPHTVAELARTAFACVDLDPAPYIRVDDALLRRAEPARSLGDPTKARERLGWLPTLTFEQLVERMVKADMRSLQAAGPVQASP